MGEFDRLEQSEPPTEGELQAARLLWMRRGEAYELWLDMLEKLHELEGNEGKLRTLKDERARNVQMYGPRLDTRARLERAFLDEETLSLRPAGDALAEAASIGNG